MANSNARPFSAITAFTTPQRRLLSEHELRNCSEALTSFQKKLLSPEMIDHEFEILEDELDKLDRAIRCKVAQYDENRSKNRYERVLPFDNNRVTLNKHKDYTPSPMGYINASFLTTSEGVSKFIATQGPLPETSKDFWEMIIQYKCPAILMLAQLVESNTVKCGDYFQTDDGPREFGKICITLKWKQTTDTSLILQSLEVKNKKSEEPPHTVLHIQYLEWPDSGVPKNSAVLREIFEKISSFPLSLGPTVVHCSAGIGRTGSYCLIHQTVQRILNGDMTALDLFKTLTTLRSQRVGLVEKLEQYHFCHNAIVDELKSLISDSNSHGGSS